MLYLLPWHAGAPTLCGIWVLSTLPICGRAGTGGKSSAVKVINFSTKSEYTMDYTGKFFTVNAIKTKVAEIFEHVTQVGYNILPGHGLKGKQYFINTDNDLSEMYISFKGKYDILLWCWYNSEVILDWF